MAHTESFSCHPVDDRDIIDFLAKQPSKSATIKKALRLLMKYGRAFEVSALLDRLDSLDQLTEAVLRIEQQIKSGVQLSVQGSDEPPIDSRLHDDIMGQMDFG